MKYIIAGFLLLASFIPAKAGTIGSFDMQYSSLTVRTVTCSSTTPTLMDSTTSANGAMIDRDFLAYQNFSPSSATVIGFQSDISCTANSFYLPANYDVINVPAPVMKRSYLSYKLTQSWCMSCANNAASKVALIQGKR